MKTRPEIGKRGSLPSMGEPAEILWEKGASSVTDHGELGRSRTTGGRSSGGDDGCWSVTSVRSCRGSVRPASRDRSTGKSGYRYTSSLQPQNIYINNVDLRDLM